MPMDEGSSSWIRRTKFSPTVYHRFDSPMAIRASIPLFSKPDEILELKSRPKPVGVSKKSAPLTPNMQRNPLTNKQRSVSPIPGTVILDTFKEAQSDKRRFSTPFSRKKESDKDMGKDKSDPKSSSSPLRNLSPLKGFGRSKTNKDSSWNKYFDHRRGKVTAADAAEEHMVDLSQLFLGLKFAHGAHSRLYHGKYKGEAVAVKMIRVPEDEENKSLAARLDKQFNREVTHLSHLHHPNVIKFVAACRQPPVYCVITEYLSEGSLRAYLHKLEHKILPLEKVIDVALEIARGMEYIHSQGVIHRDLKPENILIDEAFHMKIADFGIACEEAYCDRFTDDPGTYRWMAPEMIKHKSYGRKVDVYSFGLILWEMVSGRIPYEEMTPIQAAFAVVNKNIRPCFPEECPPAMRALIEQCWSLQPNKRPEFSQIAEVLGQFQSSISKCDTLKMAHIPVYEDPKKGSARHWTQNLGSPNANPNPVMKPKFS